MSRKESIQLELSDEETLALMKEAHRFDLTFNMYIEKLVINAIQSQSTTFDFDISSLFDTIEVGGKTYYSEDEYNSRVARIDFLETKLAAVQNVTVADEQINALAWNLHDWLYSNGSRVSSQAFNTLKPYLVTIIKEWVDAKTKPQPKV